MRNCLGIWRVTLPTILQEDNCTGKSVVTQLHIQGNNPGRRQSRAVTEEEVKGEEGVEDRVPEEQSVGSVDQLDVGGRKRKL